MATSTELTIRTFDNNDWENYAGAEEFPDGSDPVVVEDARIDGLTWEICVAANGIMLCTMDVQTDAATSWVYHGDFPNRDFALAWLTGLLQHGDGIAVFERARFRQ